MGEFNPRLFRPRLDIPRVPYHELLRRSVERTPEKWAISFHDQRLTFRELEGLSNALANGWRSLHVAKGDRIALFMTNRPEYVISLEAASKLGAAITPINPSYREHEAEYQLGNSEARVVVVHEDHYPVIAAIRSRLPALKHVLVLGNDPPPGTLSLYDVIDGASAERPPEVAIDVEEDLVALPFSSGTTGLPKGVMLTHHNLVANFVQFASAARVTDRDVMLIFLPFYHIYGTMLFGAAVASGALQVIMEKFDLQTALALTEQHRVTLFYAVPPVLLALINYPDLRKHDFSSVRYIMSGAAPLPPEIGRRMRELSGVQVIQGYGLTEASPLTHLSSVDNPDLVRDDSVGQAVANQEEKVLDLEDEATELGVDSVGELVIRGPQVMKGYWKAPQETTRALRNGWLHTGDIARRDANGYVYLVDRKKEMIKYKGFGVAPAELEAVLHEHAAVADCAVVGKRDDEAGEIPCAYVVRRAGTHVSENDLIRFVEERVAGYKKIRVVEFIEEIPKNPSGKILRRLLKERQ